MENYTLKQNTLLHINRNFMLYRFKRAIYYKKKLWTVTITFQIDFSTIISLVWKLATRWCNWQTKEEKLAEGWVSTYNLHNRRKSFEKITVISKMQPRRFPQNLGNSVLEFIFCHIVPCMNYVFKKYCHRCTRVWYFEGVKKCTFSIASINNDFFNI